MREAFGELNQEQRQAVTARLGPVLVLAGAGSGKTRVLTYRIAYLLRQKLFTPREILALTFTNKAAGEMKERIDKLLGKSQAGLTMGTFHSVCARILRIEIENLKKGYDRNFVIYDTEDSARLVKQIVTELGLGERIRPNVFSYYISAAKNRLVSPQALALDNNFFRETISSVFDIYQARLRENNALDFDDLLGLAVELFRFSPAILKKYQTRFRYVLVDEYQDTNQAQYLLLKMLVSRHRNLFVVGDDAQSIYGFRGANMQNILNFQKDYPKAAVIMLEQNYRSTQNILDAATGVIRLNDSPYDKKLWTNNHPGEKIKLYEAVDETDESEFVIRQILARSSAPQYEQSEELVYETEETPILNSFMRRSFRPPARVYAGELPQDLADTVVLYRTHAQSRPFEEALLSSGIPYQIIGGIKFYERKEIKDVLSYLRLLSNPRDLVSLGRVINLPARGIGAANFKLLVKLLPKYQFNYSRMFLNLDDLTLQPKARAGARDFFGLFAAAAKVSKQKSVLELMHLIVNRSGYKDSLLDGSKEGQDRWENVEELFNVAAKYKELDWSEGLRNFLEEVALMTDLDNAPEQKNSLTLMTLHSAKGLEFDSVFLVGLEEGLLPHTRSLLSPAELAEEIRLAYVGMTRARRDLFLSYARQRQTFGELKQAIPSRIIKAIPAQLLVRLAQRNK